MPQSVGEKRRSDFGSFGYTKRDHEGLLLVASMKFVRFDHLGQFLAPGLEPATEERRSEPHKKKQRGGKRDTVPWPADYQRRLHATTELVRRWEKKMGYAETWKPWSDAPIWVRVTETGLKNLGLSWNDIPFPEERSRLSATSHTYQVNKRRLALARGGAQAPSHEWISERAIHADQCRQGMEQVERAHRPDGVMRVTANGSFPFQRGSTVLEQIPLTPGQLIAVEVELSRKKFARIGSGILPSLLQTYQYVWYFCGNPEVYQTVIAARRDYLQTNEERKRIRILLLEEQVAEEDDET